MRVFAVILLVFSFTSISAAHAHDVIVPADHITIVRLNDDAATVVVGNPAIADVMIHDPRTLFITGHVFGQTNLIVLNADGQIIRASDISVTASGRDHVAVFKNSRRYTLVCDPVCQHAAIVGDEAERFDLIQSQRAAARNEGQTAAGN